MAVYTVQFTPSAGFLVGLALWTLVEYLLHRFAFHGFAPHYQHHADPADPKYILAPFRLSLSSIAGLWGLASIVAGSIWQAAPVVAGVVVGYLAYEWVHLRLHSRHRSGWLTRILRKHHFHHHYANDRVCYGVTSPIWDFVLRSVPQGRPARPSGIRSTRES